MIGMGRLGGGELGYGSDADVMFVCDPVQGVRRVGRGALGGDASPNRCARCWARPAPTRRWRSTPICGPRAAAARWSARSRPMRRITSSGRSRGRSRRCCGPTRWPATRSSGERFLLMADKTRYPPGGVSAEAVQEIRRIKARIDSERLPRGADPNTHTKLGRGGLADIEWTVQLLQLRYRHEIARAAQHVDTGDAWTPSAPPS